MIIIGTFTDMACLSVVVSVEIDVSMSCMFALVCGMTNQDIVNFGPDCIFPAHNLDVFDWSMDTWEQICLSEKRFVV